MEYEAFAVLLFAAALAGWVDAVVGGGGLVLLPALLVFLPGVPVATVLGTNKMTAITGTSTAAFTYARRTDLDWRVAAPAALLAAVASAGGAVAATRVPAHLFKPVILVVLVAVALFVTLRRKTGLVSQPGKRTAGRIAVAIAAAGGVLGWYDGMIGPGTGTFLILVFSTVIGTDFLHGSAMAKLVNAGTNFGALVVFAVTGHVWWLLGAGLAVCNVLGSVLGARMALRRGSRFVRGVLLVVVLALIARVGYDVLGG